LDEATSALDARTERLINDTLERVGHDRTTIAVTHRLSSLASYDQIFVVVAGAIVESGTHADLLAQRGVYAELWSEQAGETASTHHDEIALGDALRRLPAFAGLGASAMADVSSRTMRLELPAGQRVYEGDGRLYVVLAGRGEVRGADDAQALVELKAADAFGVSALLGDSAGRSVVALDAMMLAVLDRVTLHELALLHPAIGAMLSGQGMPGPHQGSRLSRATVGRGVAPLPLPLPEAPSLRASARRSGFMRSVG
jgi:ATP-binding cassette subfamily B protein